MWRHGTAPYYAGVNPAEHIDWRTALRVTLLCFSTMRPAAPLVVLLALAVMASARLQAGDRANTTTTTTTARATTATRVSPRGFCLFGCSTRKVVFHCRCSSGCRISLGYYRATDVSPSKSHCSNRAYNKGDWCPFTGILRFNSRSTFTMENRAYRLNGHVVNVDSQFDFSEHRLQGSRGAYRCNGF